MLSNMFINIISHCPSVIEHINDKPVHPNTRSFLNADDLCIATQKQSFEEVEHTLGEALACLTPYYAVTHLRANPEKTHISIFHLKNRDAQREPKCGIAPPPPHIRAVSSQLEKHKQENDPLHPLYEQDPVRKRPKSRHSFIHSVEPLDCSARTRRLTLWSSHLQTSSHSVPRNRCLQVRMRHGPPGQA